MDEGSDVPALLDDIEERVMVTPPFDLSPRGVTVRPDAALGSRIAAVSTRGDQAVPAIDERLRTEDDPFLALIWLYCLERIGTRRAAEAVDAFTERLAREQLWVDEFPGQREILLFLGRMP